MLPKASLNIRNGDIFFMEERNYTVGRKSFHTQFTSNAAGEKIEEIGSIVSIGF